VRAPGAFRVQRATPIPGLSLADGDADRRDRVVRPDDALALVAAIGRAAYPA
jgi:hypothetical protein